MRLRHPDGTTVHLAYCTNVHPAEDLDGVIETLDRYALPIRKRLGADRLSLGLWLARDAASALLDDERALARLRAELAARELEVVTLNGFPYQGFGRAVVKHAVYRPNWSQDARLRYTLDLAWLLGRLLPDDVSAGSISTLPLGWRRTWSPRRGEAARSRLDALAEGLAELAATEGREIRVGLEPEPGCVIESTADAARELVELDTRRLGVCLDTCHLAVAFEEPHAALARLAAAGIPVVKTQASNALEAGEPAGVDARAALRSFAEPRFLHQTRERTSGGPHGVDDLDVALDGAHALPGEGTWRVHFHTPLHADPAPPLVSTRGVLTESLGALFGGPAAHTPHLEVETYTWDVLPELQRPPGEHVSATVAGIAAELAWTRDQLLSLGLTEVPA